MSAGVVSWYDGSAFTSGDVRWWWTGDSGDSASYWDDYADAYEVAGWVPVHEVWLPLGDGYGLGAYGDGAYGY